MRAASSTAAKRSRPLPWYRPRSAAAEPLLPGAQLLFTLLFLTFFTLGIAVFREELPPLCRTIAAYYKDLQSAGQPFQSFSCVFLAAFFQLSFVILCAFSAFGSVLLPVHFAAKGFFCGALTLATYQLYSAKGLAAFWLMTWLPDTLLLLLSLRLAVPSIARSNEIFSWYFLHKRICAPCGGTAGLLRQYLIALLWAIPVGGLAAGFALLGSVLPV